MSDYCEIPEDIEVRIRKDGGRGSYGCPVCQFWLSERVTGTRARVVRDCIQLAVFSLQPQGVRGFRFQRETWALPSGLYGNILLKPQSQLANDGYIEVVYHRAH